MTDDEPTIEEVCAVATGKNVGGRDVCPRCLRPLANEDEWADIPGGEGDHLCWGGPAAGCDHHDMTRETRIARALLRRMEERHARDMALGDLLAVLHRDGGQHTERVGLLQSVIDAHEAIRAARLHDAETVALIERLRDELPERCSGMTHNEECSRVTGLHADADAWLAARGRK